jgi:hypothetical protein
MGIHGGGLRGDELARIGRIGQMLGEPPESRGARIRRITIFGSRVFYIGWYLILRRFKAANPVARDSTTSTAPASSTQQACRRSSDAFAGDDDGRSFPSFSKARRGSRMSLWQINK